MSLFVGFDTSNYTTSVAVFDTQTNQIINKKKLLPVEKGQKGLMQSKALFEHIRQLPQISEAAFSSFNKPLNISAVGVSKKPRMLEGSYMPVFLAGVSAASVLALANGVPLIETAHQNGHIAAALFGANRLDLLNRRFIAFHISGGTTECLLVEPDEENLFKCEIVSKTLDLNCGQIIDRAGVMLGLEFPAGASLDKLSRSGVLKTKPKAVLKGRDCCLSGIENQCKKLLENGEKKENIALFAIESVYAAVNEMTKKVKSDFGDLPVVYAGGVMSNSLIKERLTQQGGIFCDGAFSSDNAAGVALITKLLYEKGLENGK